MTTATIQRPTEPTEPSAISTDAATMRAVVQDAYGTEPEGLLRLARIDRPEVGDGEVLVRVLAAGVDRGVWHVMAGRPYLMRIAGFGLRAPRTKVPGMDVAGIVSAVGAGVTAFAPGDAVYGTVKGAFAEYAVARADRLARMPANLSFEQAAAVPVSAQTALQAVRDRAQVIPGQRVLIIGASGGVGTFAVQLAKAYGAEVTAVCSTSKLDVVRALGADRVIDYTREDFAADGSRYDAILDIGGNSRLARLRRALTSTGTLVIVGGETGGRWLGGVDRQLRATLLSPLVKQRLGTFISSESAEHLDALRGLIESGQVTPVIDRTYPLAEAAAAIRHMQDGRARGKVVVSVSSPAG
jgi:NADPH:quinone reductase-like Zn-dependent oxidoreductase